MRGKRHGTGDKARILREVDGGMSIVEVCRGKNISDVTFHRWRHHFGNLNLNEARRLKELERGNTELKKMLADTMPAKKVLECALEKIVSPEHKKQVVAAPCRRGCAPGERVAGSWGSPGRATRTRPDGGPAGCRRW